SLPAPTGPVLLSVSGAIAVTNTAKGAAFDLAMLEALPKVSFKTTTIWTEGEQSFTGVALRDVLDRLGAKGKTLKATATNDYAVKIPVSDAVSGGPIIAYLNNGKPMSLRDKGPLWIVYPYDAKPAYQTEVIYSRSIWQLDRLEVTE
ncbi:oxidoreductase, partial [Thioclava sp. BHET1]